MYINKATARKLVQYVTSSVREDIIREEIENVKFFGDDHYEFTIYRRGGWSRSFCIYIWNCRGSQPLTIFAKWYLGRRIVDQKCKSFREIKDALEEVKNAIESA